MVFKKEDEYHLLLHIQIMGKRQFKINAFLVGAQKAATTSLYDWISQHPEICAPMSMKDFPYFAKDDFYAQGSSVLTQEYEKCKDEVNINTFLQGSVSYMFYPYSIKRIFEYNPESKLILVLRNPKDRAISAHRYFVKMQKETEPFEKAIELEDERMQSNDFRIKSDLAYLNHGLYGQQLQHIYNIFPRNQVLVLLYDDLKIRPEEITRKAYSFLGVSVDFIPEFVVKNKTGTIRSPWFQKVIFGKNRLRTFLVSCINPIFPLHKRTKLRLKLREWNTNTESDLDENLSEDTLEKLRGYFEEDINLLEELTGFKLDAWKN